ncbi:DNA-binding protein [Pseudomonas sp. OV546]|uniref:DNA-binding protein n=1 Tax=Pseudomonas sp. OV546 TaxID=1881063 RepID=UPI0008E44CC0|nr:DNA-binding protein [Pseudomonas sp. OV546]SFU41735.1 replication region DNA-binding N-term [Pseudomonas sp. OV546]
MARSGINKAQVQCARDALLARGLVPSIEAVRTELGHTGSKTTINRYLRELADAEPQPPRVSLSEELQAFIQSVAARLAREAQDSVAADRARLEHQQAAYQQQRAVDSARFEQLQIAHTAQGDEYRVLSQREVELNSQLQRIEGERQRLEEACRQQVKLLEERLGQIRSLEMKHQQAREAMSHYREQHQIQRQEELQRHAEQMGQAQIEMRGLREQLTVRQEELTQLYRDLERTNSAHGHLQQQLRQLERQVALTQQQRVSQDAALAKSRQDGETMASDLAAQHEKAKYYLLAHRQDQRLIRAQAKQINRLQAFMHLAQIDHPGP